MDAALAGPHELTVRLPEDEEQLCRRYGRARFLLSLAELLLLLITLVCLTLSGAAGALLAFARPAGTPAWLSHVVYLVFVGVITRVVLLPVQWLSEHWLECRYGMSRQPLTGWLVEWLCRSAVFGVAILAVLFPLVESLKWWPLLALPWCFAFPLLRNAFYDWIYYPLLARFYPVRYLRSETFNLPGIGKVTLPVFQVQVSHKTCRCNAAIRLRGRETAIYVSDTLIDEFTDGEERVVMAHEFGHLYDRLHLESRTRAGVAQAHRKLMWGSVQLVAGCAGLVVMHLLAPVLHLQGVSDLAGFPLLAALVLTLGNLFSPWLCAEARKDERDADEYALAVTGDVENYVSVMRKLRRLNLEESASSPLNLVLFDTHPSYNERLHLALTYRRRHTDASRRRKPASWRGWRNVQRHGRR